MMKEEEATGETEGSAKPVTTTIGPWCLPRPVVAATGWPWWFTRPWQLILPPVLRFLERLFVFPHDFSVYAAG